MKNYILTTLFGLFSFLSLSQGLSVSDSLLNNQVNATKKLYREIIKFNDASEDVIKQLNINLNNGQIRTDSLIKEVSDLNLGIQSIKNEIRNSSIKKEEESFKVWSFISGALAEMIGAFIGVGAAFWLFFKESKRDKKKEKEIAEIDMEEKIHYFGSLLNGTIKLGKLQKEEIIKYYEGIDKNPTYIPLITLYPDKDLKRLTRLIDNEEYYHAFLNKQGIDLDNVKKYRRISRSIDFLSAQFAQMNDMQEKAQSFDYERKYKYKEIVEKMTDSTLEFGKIFENQVPGLMEFIVNTFEVYYKGLTDHTDLDYIQNTFVRPVVEGIVASYMQIPQARFIAQQLKNATFLYTEIRMQNTAQSSSFKKVHEEIKAVLEFLDKDAKELIEPFKGEEITAANTAYNDQAC
jgi:hypothetical protein